MLDLNSLEQGGFRLLEVDNRVVLPYLTEVRLLVSAADVLHA
jgi:cytochrome c oxidase subunit 2